VTPLELDRMCVNTIRFLPVDMVEKASSGHPGLPMGAAPIAYVLWTRFLRHSPANPRWWDRDRFVLSAGHGSALLYSLLHLTGYDLPLEQLKRFRQWGSQTPGHPESHLTAGVEASTGPLGQGVGNALGMAIAHATGDRVLSRQRVSTGARRIREIGASRVQRLAVENRRARQGAVGAVARRSARDACADSDYQASLHSRMVGRCRVDRGEARQSACAMQTLAGDTLCRLRGVRRARARAALLRDHRPRACAPRADHPRVRDERRATLDSTRGAVPPSASRRSLGSRW